MIMASLTDIRGIASKTASTLKNSGIETVEELAEAEPSDIDGMSESKASKIIRRASQQTITSKTAADLLDEYTDQEYVSTGIDELDEIIGGGWEPETVGMVYGKSGSGKTQIVFSSMSTLSSEGTVVYLMTEVQSKSIADRLRSLANNVDDLSNIYIYEAHDVDEQYDAYEAIGEDFDEIDLFVVDSFTAQFRMTGRFDGRENYGERSSEMGRHLRKIGEMSRVFQCPVVMTGQVYESPEMFSGPEDLYGGQKMEHFISYFVRMSSGDGKLRKAGLENHAGIQENEIQLRIGENEIVGASK